MDNQVSSLRILLTDSDDCGRRAYRGWANQRGAKTDSERGCVRSAHEPLMLRQTLLTTDHYLDYNIHLEWERRIKEGLL